MTEAAAIKAVLEARLDKLESEVAALKALLVCAAEEEEQDAVPSLEDQHRAMSERIKRRTA